MTKKPTNRSLKAMIEKSKEQQRIKKFNKSKEGMDLHDRVRKLREKHYPSNPDTC